ncbi:MAG: lipid-A-disaccharide synthase [Neomegalonema sp.]|nr:lipid-A-disaccharide synthase [Neomegalonema sp.]
MSSAPKATRFFLIAGEPSGDRLGAALMRGLRKELGARAEFIGVGGAAMQAEGLESLFDIKDIAVMGMAEVLPKLRMLKRRIEQTAQAVIASAPDALITIDAPGFGLRVAARARAQSSGKFIHYVAPSVWAWRPKRAEMMARHTDHLLALLPFEPPYFERVSLACDFVGHPVVEATEGLSQNRAELRAALDLPREAPLLMLLPGSRRGEVTRLGPIFMQTAKRVSADLPGLEIVVPAAENVADLVADLAGSLGLPCHVIDPRGRPFAQAERRKFQAMGACDVALAASGTVSLELAAMGVPMVIGYKMNWLTAQMVRRLVKIDTATLVNLLVEEKVVPEYFQENCTAEKLAPALLSLFPANAPARQHQIDAATKALAALGRGGLAPSERAARSVLAALQH